MDAPPPPYVPPPDVTTSASSGISIASTTTVPTAPVAIAPPPPPAPVVRPAVNRNDIGVACPTQVQPEMPRKAQQEGIEGVVRAQIRIKGGVVQDVTMTGPRVFYAAVRCSGTAWLCC